jgi:perosamine synthetase
MLVSRLHCLPRFALPYRAADFAAALIAIFARTPSLEAFRLLGNSTKCWTQSGRQALWLILRALDLKPGSRIALPLFTDPSLVTAVVAAGHRPFFIDIEPQFLTMDPKSLNAAQEKFAAVVAVHLFGQMADMPAILAAAGDVPVIEDTAHAPLSFLNGHLAGTFGVASFFSFASTKYWPAGGGGLAMVNDPELARTLQREASVLSQPSRLHELRNVFLQSMKAAVFKREVYGIFGKPMRAWAEKWALLEPKLNVQAIERPYAAVACRQAERFSERVELQRANSLRLLSRLSAIRDVILPQERKGARYNYHLFPVLLRDGRERSAVMSGMWNAFVDTSKIYSDVVEKCRGFGYANNCPVSESVAERLITLPNYAGLAETDIDNVAKIFTSTLHTYRSAEPALREYPACINNLI